MNSHSELHDIISFYARRSDRTLHEELSDPDSLASRIALALEELPRKQIDLLQVSALEPYMCFEGSVGDWQRALDNADFGRQVEELAFHCQQLKDAGCIEEAVVIGRSCCELARAHFPPDDVRRHNTLMMMGSLCDKAGDTLAGIKYIKELLAILKEALPAGHKQRLMMIEWLALQFMECCEYEEEFKYRKELVEELRDTSPADDPKVLDAQYYLYDRVIKRAIIDMQDATVPSLPQDLEYARQGLDRTLVVCRKVLSSSHRLTTDCLKSLALYSSAIHQDYERALEYYEETVDIEWSKDPSSDDYFSVLQTKGIFLHLTGQCHDALTCYQKVIESLRVSKEDESTKIAYLEKCIHFASMGTIPSVSYLRGKLVLV